MIGRQRTAEGRGRSRDEQGRPVSGGLRARHARAAGPRAATAGKQRPPLAELRNMIRARRPKVEAEETQSTGPRKLEEAWQAVPETAPDDYICGGSARIIPDPVRGGGDWHFCGTWRYMKPVDEPPRRHRQAVGERHTGASSRTNPESVSPEAEKPSAIVPEQRHHPVTRAWAATLARGRKERIENGHVHASAHGCGPVEGARNHRAGEVPRAFVLPHLDVREGPELAWVLRPVAQAP